MIDSSTGPSRAKRTWNNMCQALKEEICQYRLIIIKIERRVFIINVTNKVMIAKTALQKILEGKFQTEKKNNHI